MSPGRLNANAAMDATGPKGKLAGDCGSGAPGQLNNAQTAAIIGTNLAVGIGIGAMICVSTSAILADLDAEFRKLEATMEEVRVELKADIGACAPTCPEGSALTDSAPPPVGKSW